MDDEQSDQESDGAEGGAGAAGNEENAEGDGDTRLQPKVVTKAQLYRAYAGKGPCEMFTEFMLSMELKQNAIIIVEIASALEEKYSKDLAAQAGDQADVLKWALDRARSHTGWPLPKVSWPYLSGPTFWKSLASAVT